MKTRREFIAGGAVLVAGVANFSYPAAGGGLAEKNFVTEAARIEKNVKGRLGIAVLGVNSGTRFSYREAERFPLCSTFKLLAAACVLRHIDRGTQKLDRRVVFGRGDLVTYSPVTEKHTGGGMTIAELCEAAITLSDNTAGNLILASIGGPQGFTNFVRSLGDNVTRLDRIETALNEATPGDPRDTTTPGMMAEDIRQLLFGDALQAQSKEQLKAWLLASKTGGDRMLAGLPEGWRVGDKTGTGGHDSTNDAGVIWPV